MSGPRGSAERQSAQMCADRMRTEIISLRAEVERLKGEWVRDAGTIGRLVASNSLWQQLADELNGALLGCDAPRGATGLDAARSAALANHAKMKGE